MCGEGPGQARSEPLGEAVCKNGVLGTGIVTQSKDWKNEITWPGPQKTELCGQGLPGRGDSTSKGSEASKYRSV